MKLSPFISLGEWLPDLADYEIGQNLSVCTNVIPSNGFYKPFPELLAAGTALTAACKGAYAYLHSDLSVKIFAGDATKLYLYASNVPGDVSRTSGGAYNTATEDRWQFLNYGNRVIATNYNDVIQSYLVGTDTDFSELSSGAPKARCMAVVNNFLMLGNTSDGTFGDKPERVWWSAIDNPTSFPTAGSDAAKAVQSDYQDLVGNGGHVRAIVGAQNYAVIFQDKAIWRGEYVGLPTVFNFSLAEDNKGTKIGNSVVSDGRLIYYLDEDGFYVFDGVQSTSIGANKVDDYFKADIKADYVYNMSSAYDPLNKLIMWLYTSVNSADNTPDKVAVFHTQTKAWAILEELDIQYLVNLLTVGYDMDTDIEAGDIPLDTSAYPSLDSISYVGGKYKLAAFDTDATLGYFTGNNLDATITTGEFQFNEGGRAFLSSVLPITDSNLTLVEAGTRSLLSDTPAYNSSGFQGSITGEAPLRSDSPYHRIRFSLDSAATWTYIKGFKVKVRPTGEK